MKKSIGFLCIIVLLCSLSAGCAISRKTVSTLGNSSNIPDHLNWKQFKDGYSYFRNSIKENKTTYRDMVKDGLDPQKLINTEILNYTGVLNFYTRGLKEGYIYENAIPKNILNAKKEGKCVKGIMIKRELYKTSSFGDILGIYKNAKVEGWTMEQLIVLVFDNEDSKNGLVIAKDIVGTPHISKKMKSFNTSGKIDFNTIMENLIEEGIKDSVLYPF